MNLDYINLGFSGNAKGELAMADYINTLDFSVFVYDYDHNAPTVEHLAATHEPFFRRIREAHPTVPVIMLTRPHATYGEDEIARRAVVKATYDHAKAEGDENVYFINGYEMMSRCGHDATIDGTHPNDLGFDCMANTIGEFLSTIIK
jgi:lysophospholipase L1-like esterase